MSGSCCGGKGVSIWDADAMVFKCADCGAITSNDSSYASNNKNTSAHQHQWGAPKKCTCGATKTYGDNATHSSWCDVK